MKYNHKLIEIQEHLLRMDPDSNLSDILIDILEKIMKLEREEFLKDSNKHNKGNGYYQRLAKLLNRKFTLSIPRDRDGLFKPLIIEIIKNYQKNYYETIKQLYLKGFTHNDISDIMNEIYGNSLSSGAISNITNGLLEEFNAWQKRELEDEYVAIYIDTIYCKLRRGESYENEGFTIALGLKYDGTREILGVYSTPNESIYCWEDVLDDIKKRGVKSPLLIVADGINGFENIVNKVFPKAKFQKCVVHKKRNILKRVRSQDKQYIAEDLKEVFNVHKEDTKEEAKERLEKFIRKWEKKYKFIRSTFREEVVEYYLTYLDFPLIIRSMIYTTNRIERFNNTIRKKLKVRRGLPNEEAVYKLIFAGIMEMEEKYSYKISQVQRVYNELLKILEKMYN
ncbi:IS256 family transposase [Candidatus Absconditicoccus praedator]|uniref:IS256 family transposase n=1 Tax=Candidatus Absconditicoccus praedator TaxID=2735562 RepID=UPI001E3A9859|nr:IS256 family transposase [Candidatus Absconditicoccus praedator]UFX82722.1 IS256 family transposase [Candidatus Absconditicoccus praedator]